MSTIDILEQVNTKLAAVRELLAREVSGRGDGCLTCSFVAISNG